MSNVAIFEPGETPQYLTSVNTPEYQGNPNAIINPNVSLLQGVPVKYWKRVGNLVQAMSLAEKQAVDAADLLKRQAQADSFAVDLLSVITALIKVINLRLPIGQKITKQEMIDAVKAEIT